MINKFVLAFLIFFASYPTFAITLSDTTAVVEHNSRWVNLLSQSRNNPAFMSNAYHTSYTQIGIATDYCYENKAIIQQLGNRHLLNKAFVHSYLKLGNKSTVWGGASYQYGNKYNIRYCSTSDYALLEPYVMADTIGGNLINEQYTFYGGYAFGIGKWEIGATLHFRAEHEYRMIDPRPRGIATELNASLGVHYLLSQYQLGFGIGTNVYRQTNDVQFYNELGVKPEYHATGLGTDYLRFAGANRTCHYKGLGLIANLHLKPAHVSGLYGSAQYLYIPYKKILTEINALPISTLYLQTLNTSIGWKQNTPIGYALYCGVNVSHRRGNEHIAGSASGSEYVSLITLSMYRHIQSNYYVGAAFNIDKKTHLIFDVRVGYQVDAAQYERLERIMDCTKMYTTMGLQYIVPLTPYSWFMLDADMARYAHRKDRLVMPYVTMNNYIINFINDRFTSLTSSYTNYHGKLSYYLYPKTWRGVGLFVTFSSNYLIMNNRSQKACKGSIGATF